MPTVPTAFCSNKGLNDNAAILKDTRDTEKLLSGVLETQSFMTGSEGGGSSVGGGRSRSGGGGGGGLAEEELALEVVERVDEMIRGLPEFFDEVKINSKFPIKYEDSLTTILRLETSRCNKLLGCIRGSLTELRSALRGEIVMSVEAEETYEDVLQSALPESWKKVSYPTEQQLEDYLDDLAKRVEFFRVWVDSPLPARPPKNFWISGIVQRSSI